MSGSRDPAIVAHALRAAFYQCLEHNGIVLTEHRRQVVNVFARLMSADAELLGDAHGDDEEVAQ